ncbi:DUF1450 domain-containing protein [Peribacillus butanolivorans]|uniref:DUF1450 domain-containing protein n=1 Tax=Peribacillus butanolivorans TaxID=421767 RepID=UPI0036B64348
MCQHIQANYFDKLEIVSVLVHTIYIKFVCIKFFQTMHFATLSDKIKITYIYSSNESSDMMKTFLSKMFTKKEKIHIEFCQNNLDRFLNEQTLAEFGKFLRNPRIQYKEYECLSECKLCNKAPYAKVNGQIMSGENTQDLLNQLQNILK